MSKNKKIYKNRNESDSLFILKILLYFILGCLWIQFESSSNIVIPVGFIFGLALVSHDHFMIDRKIEYFVLLIAMILSFIAPIGFILNFN